MVEVGGSRGALTGAEANFVVVDRPQVLAGCSREAFTPCYVSPQGGSQPGSWLSRVSDLRKGEREGESTSTLTLILKTFKANMKKINMCSIWVVVHGHLVHAELFLIGILNVC